MTFPRKVYTVSTQPGLLPASVGSWHNTRSTYNIAHGRKAVPRKQHAIFKVWTTARATQAWPHTTTLYFLWLINSQCRNNSGPHSAFIHLPDHVGKQTDEHLREPSKTSPAAKPARPLGHFSFSFFEKCIQFLCALGKYLKTLISHRDTLYTIDLV